MGRNQSGSVRAVVIFSLSDFFLPIGVVAVFHAAFFGKNKQLGEEKRRAWLFFLFHAPFFLPPCYGGLPNRRPETEALTGGQAEI